jgi:release factor glutamine methyltransferase
VTPLDTVRGVAHDLRESGVPSPRVDAEILVAHVAGLRRSELYASNDELTDDQLDLLQTLVDRRRKREPLAYVLGEWGFRRLTLELDRRVLVPRPETEVLVERCLEHLRDLAEPRVLDIGAGSGAIALALADEHPGAKVLAVDRSAGALEVAQRNLTHAGVNGRVELRQGDLLAGIKGPFDLVVSNPPYVSPEEYEGLQPEIRLYEPREALVGVGVGREIAGQARGVLETRGWLVLECGDGQASALAADLEELGYRRVGKGLDLAGRERIVEGRWE